MVNKSAGLFGLGITATSLAFIGTVAPAQAAGLTPDQIAGLDLGSALGYGIINIADDNEKFTMNSGPVAGGMMGITMNDGSVIVGGGTEVSFSGGNSGEITGTLFYDAATNATTDTVPDEADNLENGVAALVQVTNAFTAIVKDDVIAVSNYAAAQVPDLTVADIGDGFSFAGTGGLNVINVTGDVNGDFTLSGSAMDVFVINVFGAVDMNDVMTLAGDVDPSRILFNLLDTSGEVFKTAGGNVLFGTFLSPNGGDFQFSNLNLTGSLINIDGSVQYVSGSMQSGDPFVVPEPLTMLGAGTAASFGAFFKRKVAKKQQKDKAKS